MVLAFKKIEYNAKRKTKPNRIIERCEWRWHSRLYISKCERKIIIKGMWTTTIAHIQIIYIINLVIRLSRLFDSFPCLTIIKKNRSGKHIPHLTPLALHLFVYACIYLPLNALFKQCFSTHRWLKKQQWHKNCFVTENCSLSHASTSIEHCILCGTSTQIHSITVDVSVCIFQMWRERERARAEKRFSCCFAFSIPVAARREWINEWIGRWRNRKFVYFLANDGAWY